MALLHFVERQIEGVCEISDLVVVDLDNRAFEAVMFVPGIDAVGGLSKRPAKVVPVHVGTAAAVRAEPVAVLADAVQRTPMFFLSQPCHLLQGWRGGEKKNGVAKTFAPACCTSKSLVITGAAESQTAAESGTAESPVRDQRSPRLPNQRR